MSDDEVGVDGKLALSKEDSTSGVFLVLPVTIAPHRLNATLLAAMAFPPRTPDDPAFARRVTQLCKCFWHHMELHDPTWLHGSESIPRAELTANLDLATRTRDQVLKRLNQALGGEDAIEPFFKNAIARMVVSGAWQPRAVLSSEQRSSLRIVAAKPPSLVKEIDAALDREEGYKQQVPPSQRPPKRMPDWYSNSRTTTFKRDNLRPFRPVWHLLASFSIVRGDIAGAFRHHSPVSPKLLFADLMDAPGWARPVLDMATGMEKAVPFLEGLKPPSPAEVVRLRLR